MRLPDFICIGAMRSGTTTLWAMMREMQDVYLPTQKELHFFDRDYSKGLAHYSSYFSDAGLEQKCGEFTPAYMSISLSCHRIHQDLPRVKFIAILRDPVARAWSHYRFSVRWGTESETFEKALKLEDTRMASGGLHEAYFYSYKQRGQYVDQLLRYEKAFSRESIYVTFFDHLLKDKDLVLNQIRRHIGLPPLKEFFRDDLAYENELQQFPKNLSIHQLTRKLLKSHQGDSILHRGIRKISGIIQQRNLLDTSPPMPDRLVEQLAAYYEPYDARLEEWMGVPLPWRNPN